MKTLLILFTLLLNTFAFTQLNTKGELALTLSPSFTAIGETKLSSFGFSLRGHFEADYALTPLDFRLALDPAIRLSGSNPDDAGIQVGLTELFARYALGNTDFSVGFERLTLEVARLSVPYRLDPVGELGQPLGLLGIRSTTFLDNWRIRPTALYRFQDDQLGGVMSVKRDFTAFDLEIHLVYLDGFTVGLGGSGLLGGLIMYAEAWLLTNPWDARGAIGLSGFWDDLLWTAEAAYAPNPLGDGDAYPQFLAQASFPQGGSGNLEFNLGLGLLNSITIQDTSTLQANASVLYTLSENDYQLSVGPILVHSELATIYGIQVNITNFF